MADDYLDDEDDLQASLGAYGREAEGYPEGPGAGKGRADYPRDAEQQARQWFQRRESSWSPQGQADYPPPYEEAGPQPVPPYEPMGPQPAPPYEQQGPSPQTDVQRRLGAVREYYDRQNQGWGDWISRAQARPGGLPDADARWFKKRMADVDAEEAKVREAVRGGAPLPSHWGMTMGADWMGRAQGAAPAAPFNPNAYVANLTAPPPPPIGVYRGGVSGGETPGSLPPDLEAAAYYGHALKQVEQQVLAHPHMSPQSKDIVLRKVYEDAAEVAKNQTLGKGQGAGQQQPEQQFSVQQKQALAQLDNGENNISLMHARNEVDDEGYNSAMMQIAEQRQAIRAKAIPKGPTAQEKFDAQRVTLPDGTILSPRFHTNGSLSGYDKHEAKHESTLDTLLKQNPHDSLHDIALHVASHEAETRGMPPHPDLPPLHGKAAAEKKPEKDPSDMQFRARALAELKAMQPQHNPGDPPPPPISLDAIAARAANLKQVHQQERAAREGTGKPQQPAPGGQPQGAPPGAGQFFQQTLPAAYQKAQSANDAAALFALAHVETLAKRYADKGGMAAMPPGERWQWVQGLKYLKKYDPTVSVPDAGQSGASAPAESIYGGGP